MEISIYNHVISNIKGLSFDELNQTVADATASSDENTLPGLGVIMKLLWSNSSTEEKKAYIDMLSKSLK